MAPVAEALARPLGHGRRLSIRGWAPQRLRAGRRVSMCPSCSKLAKWEMPLGSLGNLQRKPGGPSMRTCEKNIPNLQDSKNSMTFLEQFWEVGFRQKIERFSWTSLKDRCAAARVAAARSNMKLKKL